MPLPWKKAKVNRISRLVADFQSPSKRGGSLVVETGFPTSLVDLFVKNRDRLKKPSSKKKKKSNPNEIYDRKNNGFPEGSPKSSSSSSSIYVDADCLIGEERGQNDVVELAAADGGIDCDCDCDEFEECDNGLDVKSGFVKVLRIFVLIILCLSLKKFIVGITLSAFVLLFFEFVGKRMNCCFEPCFDARSVLKSLRQRFSILVKKYEAMNDSVVLDLSEICESISSPKFESCSKDIEIVESNIEMNLVSEEVISRMTKTGEVLSRHRRWGCLEKEGEREIKVVEEFEDRDDSGEVLLDKNKQEIEGKDNSGVVFLDKNQSKRNGKIKSKFLKKLVPKQLRHSKKKASKGTETELSIETSGYLEDNKLWRNEEHEAHEDGYKLLESENVRNPGCIEQEVATVDTAGVEENEETERKGNSGYIILLLIGLAGLVKGRLLAVILTIIWCLGVKLVEYRRKSVNVPNELGLISQLRVRMFGGGLC